MIGMPVIKMLLLGMVEFLKCDDEVAEPTDADEVQSMLEDLYRKEQGDHGG